MPGVRSAAVLALAASAAAGNATNSTGCLKVGFKFSDPFVPTPNSGATRSAEACQQLCADDLLGCHSFTWKSEATLGTFGPGGCFLYRFPQAVLVPSNATVDGLMVSGPANCTAPVPNGTSTPSTPLPTEWPIVNCTNDTNASSCTTAAPIVAGSGFPTWAWVLVVLGVLGLGGLAAYMLMGGSDEKPKKKKKKSERAAKLPEAEVELGQANQQVEGAPLLAPLAPEPQPVTALVPMAAPSVSYAQAPMVQGAQPTYMIPQGYALPQGYVIQGGAGQPQFVA